MIALEYEIAVLIFINVMMLITMGVYMAAIDNLNTAVEDLKATIGNLVLPINQDTAIQAAADNINTANEALKAKVA